ncbi:MAG: tetratricopeptide repeat protein [Rhodocyclaceae bacterium]|nr:tetratricopeptide repeat protein [Rhodocyclaceae bacterium]
MKPLILAVFCLIASTLNAADLPPDVARLQTEWAFVNYKLPEKDQEAAFKILVERARAVSEKMPGRAESLIWEGIVLAGYAKAKGGLGALGLAEKSRDRLLEAERIDPNAMMGSVYTSLGSLHYKVPGWPISFGDKKKAREYLQKALTLNPNGIDSNYFWADFLHEQGDYAAALAAYRKALSAPSRPGREDADAGRRAEIMQGIKETEARL